MECLQEGHLLTEGPLKSGVSEKSDENCTNWGEEMGCTIVNINPWWFHKLQTEYDILCTTPRPLPSVYEV